MNTHAISCIVGSILSVLVSISHKMLTQNQKKKKNRYVNISIISGNKSEIELIFNRIGLVTIMDKAF